MGGPIQFLKHFSSWSKGSNLGSAAVCTATSAGLLGRLTAGCGSDGEKGSPGAAPRRDCQGKALGRGTARRQ